MSMCVGGEAQGISIELVREASKRLGITPVFVELPFPRMLEQLRQGRIDAAIDIFRSSEREEFLYYPDEQKRSASIMLFVHSASDLDIRTLDDARKSTIGAVRDYYYGEGVLESLGESVCLVSSNESLYKMLAEGRIEVALGNALVAQYYIDKFNLGSRIRPVFSIATLYYNMVFSKMRGLQGHDLANLFAEEMDRIIQERNVVAPPH